MGTADISEFYKGNRKYDILTEVKSTEDMEKPEGPTREPSKQLNTSHSIKMILKINFRYLHRENQVDYVGCSPHT